MPVRELHERMDSQELTEWLAYCRYYEPFGDEWRQTAMQMTATLAPYCKAGTVPQPERFMPLKEVPQTEAELAVEMRKLAAIAQRMNGGG